MDEVQILFDYVSLKTADLFDWRWIEAEYLN